MRDMIGSEADLRAISQALHAVNGPWLPGVLERESRLVQSLRDAPGGLTFTELRARINAYGDLDSSDDAWRLFRTDLWHLRHAGVAIDEVTQLGEPRRYMLRRAFE
jgi:hypothetical protein